MSIWYQILPKVFNMSVTASMTILAWRNDVHAGLQLLFPVPGEAGRGVEFEFALGDIE